MLVSFQRNIKRMPAGKVFTTAEVMGDAKNAASANRLLGMMVDAGTLRRISRGRYFKPEESEFGTIPVSTQELVKDLLFKNGMPIAYISGLNAMNELGLTTQVPADITLACTNEKKAIVRNQVRIRFIKQPNTINKTNIPLLRLLDCLRFIKKTPDNNMDGALRRLLYLIGELKEEQLRKMVRLAGKYNPQVRAMLGAIMEQYYPTISVETLRNSLNGLTTYPLQINQELLPNQSHWNIV